MDGFNPCAFSIVIVLAGILAVGGRRRRARLLGGTAFCVGSFMKRGSSLIPFILMSVVIPVVVLLVGSYTENWALGYLPSFLGEAALGLLGSTMTGSVGMPILGNIDLNNIVPMAVVGVVWGFAFLILGLIQTKRREM